LGERGEFFAKLIDDRTQFDAVFHGGIMRQLAKERKRFVEARGDGSIFGAHPPYAATSQ
jgi:hypothetical protein